ncbi:hypothetical protein ACFOWE_15220 [Planomonospora corallina]|uniref:Uncharacterized protein n=1 Tax=Planomonospora corallina TaxID=1806052 RepID=A0ABV8I641_9ACTN
MTELTSDDFRIKIDCTDMEVLSGADAPIVCRIWMEFSGAEFPEAGWWDFPGSVLGSMTTALKEISTGEPEAEAFFFDGPYRLEMRVLGAFSEGRGPTGAKNREVRLLMVCDRPDPPEAEAVVDVPISVLARSVEAALLQLMAEARRRGLTGAGVEVLGDIMSALQRIE